MMNCWHPLPNTRTQNNFWIPYWGSDCTSSKKKKDPNNIDDDDDNDNDEFSDCSIIYYNVVLDIVGIMGLASLQRVDYEQKQQQQKESDTSLSRKITAKLKRVTRSYTRSTEKKNKVLNPYCIVKLNNKEIHRTSIIYNDECPIYTIETKSLCIIPIPEYYLPSLIVGDVDNNTNNDNNNKHNHHATAIRRNKRKKEDENNSSNENHTNKIITIEICHGKNCLGIVSLSTQQLWHGTGERIEYHVQPIAIETTNTITNQNGIINESEHQQRTNNVKTTTTAATELDNAIIPAAHRHVQEEKITPTTSGCVLSLRYRKASEHDILFLNQFYQITNNNNNNNTTKTNTTARGDSGGDDDDNDLQLLLLKSDECCTATDMSFKTLKYQSIFQKRYKKIKSSKTMQVASSGNNNDNNNNIDEYHYFVKPGPDPDNKEKTEYMTKKNIYDEAMKPSKQWVISGESDQSTATTTTTSTSTSTGPTTGSNALTTFSYGTIYLEIIGCDNLPNMDPFKGVTIHGKEKSDPFVAIVYEDNMVRTDVLWDCYNPRWMPWTTRSFAFTIKHPSSLLMIGVFDYDSTSLDHHDPIGRVVITPSNFDPNVSYILHYKLHHDGITDDADNLSRGTIIVRLRIDWKDPVIAMKMSFVIPPQIIINVPNEKSFAILRYLTRGAIDRDQASMDSIQLYIKEITSFGSSYLYCIDVLWEVILWRGRFILSDGTTTVNNNNNEQNHHKRQTSIWFPIHSIVLWLAVIFVIEYPKYIGPVFIYGITWILLSINYHASRNPDPWRRIKPIEESSYMMYFGRPLYKSVSKVEPNEGKILGSRLEKLDKLKQRRVSALFTATMFFMLKLYRIYSKTSGPVITTEWKEWHFMAGKLYYFHLFLKMMCKYLCRFRNFVNWKSHYTCVFTINLLLIATIWLILPINTILFWMLRISAWILLGPFMKIVDVIWVQSWYRTKDQLLELIDSGIDVDEIDPDLPDFDSLLESLLDSKLFISMIHAGRVSAEDMYKLKEMRNLLFGKYSDLIPYIDNSRCPSIPLPQSSAISLASTPSQREGVPILPQQRTLRTRGQSLHGNIIPSHSNVAINNESNSYSSSYGEGKKTN